MKVSIASPGRDTTGEVDLRVDQRRFFIVVGTDGATFTTHDNTQNLNAGQGADTQVALNVVSRDEDAGSVRPYMGTTSSARDSVGQFGAGRGECGSTPNGEGHRV